MPEDLNALVKKPFKDIAPNNLPLLYNRRYTNRQEREADISLSINDLGIKVIDWDTKKEHKLISINPNVWEAYIQSSDRLPPMGAAGGDLEGSFPNPRVRADSHIHTPGVTIPDYPVSLPPIGPAGGDLAGTYPNPYLKEIPNIQGTYTNPVITTDTKGRIVSIANGLFTGYNGVNIGSGFNIFKSVEDNTFSFRKLNTLSDNLSIAIIADTLTLDLVDVITKTDGNFTTPVSAPLITATEVEANILRTPLNILSPSNVWVPDLEEGNIQSRIVIGNINIASPINYQAGDRITLVIIQDEIGGRQVTFDAEYKLNASVSIDQTPGAITKLEGLILNAATILTDISTNYAQ
jgi:hypothetical protein